MDIREFLEKGHEIYLPHLSIDIVIIGYQEKKLKCLLLKFGDKWILPGGYIDRTESVENAAYRNLKERTQLEEAHLSFLSIFGEKDREFSEEFKAAADRVGIEWKDDYWVNGRFVTMAYYSLVRIEEVKPVVKGFDSDYGWFDFDELPRMWMDHLNIVETVREKLKNTIRTDLIAHHLLEDPFTMPQLHKLHEVILDERIDRSRFQKKMLAAGIYERLPKLQKETPGSNPYLYRVKT